MNMECRELYLLHLQPLALTMKVLRSTQLISLGVNTQLPTTLLLLKCVQSSSSTAIVFDLTAEARQNR